MTLISNIQWLNKNGQRSFPLKASSSFVDDYGRRLPENLLVDARVWTSDKDIGTFYIGSVSASVNLVTVTLMVDTGAAKLLAGILYVAAPVLVHASYKFESKLPGVQAWMTLGLGIEDADMQNWSFSNANQSAIDPVLVSTLPENADIVTSIQKLTTGTKLSGLVKFASGDEDTLKIEYVPRTSDSAVEIDSVPVNAVIFRLNEQLSGIEIHSQFLGPCENSPESGTCRRPAIFSINNVEPDCDGTINMNIYEVVGDGEELFAVSTGPSSILFTFNLSTDELCSRTRPPIGPVTVVDPACFDPCAEIPSEGPDYGIPEEGV